MQTKNVYILTNEVHPVLYTDATLHLWGRVLQHKNKEIKGFANRYSINKLVFYEEYQYIDDAIKRVEKIKSGTRKKKI